MADSDISLKVVADKLGKSLEGLASSVENEINQAVKNLAHATYTSIAAKIQSMSLTGSNRTEYLKALKFKNLGKDSYLIFLDGPWAKKLEEGYGPYSIRDAMLKSSKTVEVGSRAGQPWVRTAKDGHKWAVVPFEHKQNTSGAKGGDLASDIKQMFAQNSKGEKQRLTKIFKDIDGNPIHGKVATVTDSVNDKFQGMVKYQSVSDKGKVSSVYMTYRGVSETGKDWIHPGSKGYQLFKQAEQFVEAEMENIINTVLK